jgi:hypothetical protein
VTGTYVAVFIASESRTATPADWCGASDRPAGRWETVKGHLIGSGIALSEQGPHGLKGVPETWMLFAVNG